MRTRAADIASSGRDTVRRRTPNDVDESVMLHNNIFRGHAAVPPGRVLGVNAVLALQRSAGNRATGQLLCRSRVPGITAQRDDKDAPTVASPWRRKDGLLSPSHWLADPGEFLRNHPLLAPRGGLPPLPPSQVEKLIDWGTIGTAFRERRLALEDRDRGVIVAHWQLWYPVAQGLYKLPGASRLYNNPAEIMDALSATMIDFSLAGDHPNVVEILDKAVGVEPHTKQFTLAKF